MLKREILIIGHPTQFHPISTKVMGFDIASTLSEHRKARYIQIPLPKVKFIKDKILIINGLLTKPSVSLIRPEGNGLTPETLRTLKSQNNIIINNSIDDYCYVQTEDLDREVLAYEEIDGIIFTNTYTRDYFLKAININTVVIPHHYDKMFDYVNIKKLKDFKVLYGGDIKAYREEINKISKELNDPNWLCVNQHILSLIEDLAKYPCHISYRDDNSVDFYFKPGTKLASAAGSNSLIIMSRDKSHIDLIEDYPLYVNSISEIKEKYELCKSWYGTKKWDEMLGLLKDVKHKTSIKTVCKTYLKFIEELE